MRTLERYEEICMDYFNGNLTDFRKALKGLSKKEVLVLQYNLVHRMGGMVDGKSWWEVNNIIHKYL